MAELLAVSFYSVDDESAAWSLRLPSVPRVGDRCIVDVDVARAFADKWRDDTPMRLSGTVERVEWNIEIDCEHEIRETPHVSVYIKPDGGNRTDGE